MKCRAMMFAAGLLAATAVSGAAFKPVDVLVYTRWQYVKNQKTGEVAKSGTVKWSNAYHHKSTEAGAEEVRRYFTANNLSCLVTDDPSFFTSDAMKSLRLVFLCNCNHELFENAAQREAFYKFVENGGGLVATHSSSACERGSKRFRDFLGGAFERHYARPQTVPTIRADRTHPSNACLPEGHVWPADEIYLNHPDEKNIRPLLILDWLKVLPQSRASDKHGCPEIGGHVLEWCKTFGKGRIYYTALGHNPKDWGRMEWQLHLFNAAKWAMGDLPDRVGAKSADAKVSTTIDGVQCVKDGKTVWKFNIANRENKPFVHPLCLPDGRCATVARAKDHPWHLGLWFCWKYINGLNYWEPRNPAAGNLFPDGMTVVRDFKIKPKGGACDVDLALWYGPRANPGKVLLDEKRTVRFSAPDAKGGYTIRSSHEFTAREEVKFDCRRPVGYGAFSLRMADMLKDFAMTDGEGRPIKMERNEAVGKGVSAVAYTDPKSGHGIAVRVISPAPKERIYAWADHRFVNPVPMYDGVITLKPGEKLSLDYEIKVF